MRLQTLGHAASRSTLPTAPASSQAPTAPKAHLVLESRSVLYFSLCPLLEREKCPASVGRQYKAHHGIETFKKWHHVYEGGDAVDPI